MAPGRLWRTVATGQLHRGTFPINEMHLIYQWDQKVGIEQECDCGFPRLELPSSYTWVVWGRCCPNTSPIADNPGTANQRHGCFAESHNQVDKRTNWVSPAFVPHCPSQRRQLLIQYFPPPQPARQLKQQHQVELIFREENPL